MKALISISRILVGSIFILSGLIKANDTVGFSFKLDEYFSEAVFNIPFLQEYSLVLATIVCLAEIVLGVLLIIAYKPKLTTILLVAFLVFFGFLTFYSAYYNKVTDCGCFGDAIKFTPWQSFMKDVVLFILFIPFIFNTKSDTLKDQNLTKKIILISIILITLLSIAQFKWNFPIVFAAVILGVYFLPKKVVSKNVLTTVFSAIFTLGFVYYTYSNLPIKDYRPYKLKANISEGMLVPEGAKQEITHVYIENVETGEVKGVEMKDVPWNDKNWKYRSDKAPEVVEKGYEPPIHDFTIVNQDDEDITEEALLWEKVLFIVSYNYESSSEEGWEKSKELLKYCKENDILAIVLTSSNFDVILEGLGKQDIYIPFASTDETTLKTIVRSNPGFLYVEKGTIKGKWHYNNVPNKIELK